MALAGIGVSVNDADVRHLILHNDNMDIGIKRPDLNHHQVAYAVLQKTKSVMSQGKSLFAKASPAYTRQNR